MMGKDYEPVYTMLLENPTALRLIDDPFLFLSLLNPSWPRFLRAEIGEDGVLVLGTRDALHFFSFFRGLPRFMIGMITILLDLETVGLIVIDARDDLVVSWPHVCLR